MDGLYSTVNSFTL